MGGNHRPDVLKVSMPDDIMLSRTVADRMGELSQKYVRARGSDLVLPRSYQADLQRWQTMIGRHDAGDYRHTDAEMRSLRSIAQWTVDVHMELCGQPAKKIKWG